jgi:hypothetical protein
MLTPMPEANTYRPRTMPYAHQREAARRLAAAPVFALLMAMRTGKSKSLIDDWGARAAAGGISGLLIAAPAGVYMTWYKQFEDHLGEPLNSGRTLVQHWASGAGAARARALEAFLATKGRPRVLLVNTEAFSTVARARELCHEFLGQGPAMMVVDESTSIKGNSERTEQVLRLGAKAAVRRILTGLVTPKSPLDLFYQFYFLDPKILGFNSFFSFRRRYAVLQPMYFGGRTVQVVAGYRNQEELRDRIAPYSYRVQLENCYDVPAKLYLQREVELTPEQKRLYKEIKENATAQLETGEWVSATAVIVQIIRLHQILCGHIKNDETSAITPVPSNRIKSLVELLREHDGKAIVWCSYDYDVRAVSAVLAREFGEGSVARFWGGNRAEREGEEYRFLNDPGCLHMVATAAAGGRGRTWTVANLVVYYSNTHDLEHRSQSEERAQGVGKADRVTYVDLIAPGTVDEKIVRALRKKIDLAAAITGDGWRAWLID